MNKTNIAGVSINLDAFSEVKSFKDMKDDPRKPFEHLSKDDEKKAYSELWKALKGTTASSEEDLTNG